MFLHPTLRRPPRRSRALLLVALLLFALLFWPRSAAPARAGSCDRLAATYPPNPNPNLPRVVHQQWPNASSIPAHFKSWQKSVQKAFPNHTYVLWNDQDARNLIARKHRWFLPTYDAFPSNIMRVDAARTFVLYEHGGLYLDMDYEPLEDFWDRLPDDAPAFVQSYWEGFEERQNSLMSSPAQHPFWPVTWEVMTQRAPESSNPIYVTGPAMIDAAVAK